MRQKSVVVAIVQDASQRFLITYNEKWNGYTFPMQDFDSEEGFPMGHLAIECVEEDLHCQLPHATAEELEFLGRFGMSKSTGEETWYDYWVFAVNLGEDVESLLAGISANNPPQLVAPQELLKRPGLTWNTTEIVEELLERQDAVLAVVTRPGKSETEYLVIHNPNYGGYFFPVTRLKNEISADQIAEKIVRTDLGYRGEAKAEWCTEIEDLHFSSRYQQERRYLFQVCRVDLPQVDLMQPYSPLELAMCQRGKKWAWLTADQILDSKNPERHLSPTMAGIGRDVLGVVRSVPRTEPLRHSEGGIALIERIVDGEKQWLAQWNDKWKAFFFVGGHREDHETFRECVIREVCEELELQPTDFIVASTVSDRLEYIATSRGAGVPTAYTMELYETTLSPAVELQIDSDTKNAWLTEKDVRQLAAGGVRPVSVTVQVLLAMRGSISCGQ